MAMWFCVAQTAVSLPAFYQASQTGVVELCWTRVGLGVVFAAGSFVLVARLLKLKFSAPAWGFRRIAQHSGASLR